MNILNIIAASFKLQIPFIFKANKNMKNFALSPEYIEIEHEQNLQSKIELELQKTQEKLIGINTPPPKRKTFCQGIFSF